jgi:hypothetical protein
MDKETIALAIQGLEIQQAKIETAIKDLRSQLNRGRREVSIAKAPRGKRKMSAAARKAISDAQKKRWAKQKKS